MSLGHILGIATASVLCLQFLENTRLVVSVSKFWSKPLSLGECGACPQCLTTLNLILTLSGGGGGILGYSLSALSL